MKDVSAILKSINNKNDTIEKRIIVSIAMLDKAKIPETTYSVSIVIFLTVSEELVLKWNILGSDR